MRLITPFLLRISPQFSKNFCSVFPPSIYTLKFLSARRLIKDNQCSKGQAFTAGEKTPKDKETIGNFAYWGGDYR